MEPETPTSGSPVREAAAQIEAEIQDGRLALGQRLVEADVAKRLGVARTTVREAFQRLEVEGLLTSERHRGYLVRTLTRAEVRDICEVREALDALAARRSAPAFERDHRALDDLVERLEAAREAADLGAFTTLNREFHALIRETSGNAALTQVLNSLQKSVYHYQYRLLVQARFVFESQDEHQRIHQALRIGDADAAAEAMALHVRRSLSVLMTLPDAVFRAP